MTSEDNRAAIEAKSDYWNGFYSKDARALKLDLPSQFAVFFANEIDRDTPIIDFGCGSGRDTLFFAGLGGDVIGVDASQSAVDLCVEKATAFGYENTRFVCADLGAEDSVEKINAPADGPTALYARFFLHAITEEAENQFLATAAQLVKGSLFGVEFRTARDALQEKVTASHYRRFINPLDFLANASRFGFETTYFVEGFGYAKYKNDDAHVARVLMRKT